MSLALFCGFVSAVVVSDCCVGGLISRFVSCCWGLGAGMRCSTFGVSLVLDFLFSWLTLLVCCWWLIVVVGYCSYFFCLVG